MLTTEGDLTVMLLVLAATNLAGGASGAAPNTTDVTLVALQSNTSSLMGPERTILGTFFHSCETEMRSILI